MTAHAPVDKPRDYHRDYGLTGPAVMKKVAERILQAEEILHAMVLDKRITESNYNARALWLRAHLGGLRDQFAELVGHEQCRIEEDHFHSTGTRRPKTRSAKTRAKRKARR